MSKQLVPVILCGGSGTRLWPLSRETYPKQFLALTGAYTMLQDTALRLHGMPPIVDVQAPIVVCNAEHRFIAASQLASVQMGVARILLEPCGRNTAPALTLAALQSRADGIDPILLVTPADHVITNRPALHAALVRAIEVASKGAIVTFGVVPDRPEVGYGYIRRGEKQADGSYFVASFAEKPDVATAEGYLASGDYLWNSGLFMMRASIWLKAMQTFRPDILDACSAAMNHAVRDLDFVRPDTAAFTASPADSIDYAVMERLPSLPGLGIPAYVLPLHAGWSDLGSWDALWEVLGHDSGNNITVGDTVLHASTNSLLLASNRLVAGVGLRNIIVIETPDAVLVVDKAETQAVKNVVARLKCSGHLSANTHRKVHRPWGWYDSIDAGERFQVKRIVVNPGAALSLQKHHHRAEHWIVVRGTAEVTHGERVFLLGENQSTFIPVGDVHRLANPGNTPLEIIEVQSGAYLGEDDIVRFDDTYGRMKLASEKDVLS